MFSKKPVPRLQTACTDVSLVDWSQVTVVCHCCVERCSGPESAEFGDDVLGTGVCGEPVSDECETHTCRIYLVPLLSARRLPRKFNRSVSKRTRALAERRQQYHSRWRKERLRRVFHRMQRGMRAGQRFFLRWIIVGLSAALLLVLGYVLFSPVIRVREITVVRSDPRLDVEQVQQVLMPLFGRHPLFVSRLEVRALLKESMPSITDVELVKAYPAELRVTPHLEPLALRVTITGPDELQGGQPEGVEDWKDFVTEGGWYIQTATPQKAGHLPHVQLVDWGARPNPGTSLFLPDFLQRMRIVEQALSTQFGQTIVSRAVYLRAREFHLTVTTGGENAKQLTLWFDTRGTVEEQLQRYRTFLKGISPGEVTQYVDLRLKDRVVYK